MPKAPESERHPLNGLRVADFSRVLAGPFCTRILTDLGADVIKIEPPAGDLSRFLGPRRRSMSGYYMQQNCGKRNVSIDLKTPRGRELAEQIIAHSDILMENFKPGVMEELGLGHETVRTRHPELIYCSLSGFGHDGPWRDRRAFAGIAHATTGTLHRQLAISGAPAFDSVLAIGDTVSGLQATIAIMAALELRRRTGRGQFIDMAMHDSLLSIQECANFYLFPNEPTEHDFLCSWVYPCNGRLVAMPPDPRAQWERLTAVMGRPELATDDRYNTLSKREAALGELEAHIALWVAEQGSADDVVAQLEAAGFPGAKILTMGEALDSAQTRARNMTPEIDDRSGRPTRVLNTPYRFVDEQAAEAGVRGVPAFRGEDNGEVLEELLGLSSDEIAELERDGVLSSRLPDPE
jgi:crotonobetainyl-CoA:carnitine CoA-transferase CaiB-like acyl-CoA transferase